MTHHTTPAVWVAIALISVGMSCVAGYVGFSIGKWGGEYKGWTECYQGTTFPTKSQFDAMMEAYQ